MLFIKQSTAVALMFGPFLDDTDGKTYETALSLPSGNIRLSKNGGAFATTASAISLTHNEYGFYSGTFNTTDTNTLGQLVVHVSGAGALPVWRELTVLPAGIYDSWIANTASFTVYPTGVFNTTVSGLTPAALTQIVSSGNAALWTGVGATVYPTGVFTVTVSGSTPAALSQIIASGNAANWAATDGVQVTVTGLTPASLTQIVNSGNAAGWATLSTVAVTVSGFTTESLSQVVASGDAAGWNSTSATITGVAPSVVGSIVTGVFNEILVGTLDFRTSQIEQWAYTANDVTLSGTVSGMMHTYYDPTDSGLFTLEALPSGRIRTTI